MGHSPTNSNDDASTAGRPRSEESRRNILHAALQELSEKGFHNVTIEGVARRAGAGKATLYRWWPNKGALLLEALNSADERYPDFRTLGDTSRELADEIQGVISYFDSVNGQAYLDLVAASRFDAGLATAIAEQFVAGRREATRAVVERGSALTHAPEGFDLEIAMDMIWGAVYYRFLVMHEKPDAEYAQRLLEHIWPTNEP